MLRLLARLAICWSLGGPWPAAAQNLLPNPEANVNDDFWDNGIHPGSIGWFPMDSRDCPGSGSVVVQCFAVSEVVSTCVPYSAQPIFAGFDVLATADLGGGTQVFLQIETFDDSECQSPLELLEHVYGGAPATTEFQRFETDNETPPSTQSVRLRLKVDSAFCDVKVSEELLFFDTFYLGTSERIVAHDFENGESCPLTVTE